jgi:hypothetical protein
VGVLVIALVKFLEGLGHALRRIEQAFAGRIVPGPQDQRAHGGLRFLARRLPEQEAVVGRGRLLDRGQGLNHGVHVVPSFHLVSK